MTFKLIKYCHDSASGRNVMRLTKGVFVVWSSRCTFGHRLRLKGASKHAIGHNLRSKACPLDHTTKTPLVGHIIVCLDALLDTLL